MKALAFAPDLMDQSKLRGAGFGIVRSVAQLQEADVDLVAVDLTRPGVLDVVSGLSATVVGFGPHVDDQLLAAAKAAGCAEVLPRSVFFKRLERGLAGFVCDL